MVYVQTLAKGVIVKHEYTSPFSIDTCGLTHTILPSFIIGSILLPDILKFQTYSLYEHVDGIYGPNTKKALVAGLRTELNAQFGRGLTVDGIWGPKTKAACVTVRKNAEGNITYILQSALYCNGFNPGNIDGIFGDNTLSAVRSFQSAKGISVDGAAGKNTFEKLLG